MQGGTGVDMNDAQQAAQAAGVAVGAGKSASLTAVKYFAVGLLLGSIACVSVIMAATAPNGKRNLFVCIMSTAVASICGGCYAAIHFGFGADIAMAVISGDAMALIASFITVIGISFICGLPAWCFIGGVFVWFERMRGKTIIEMLEDAKRLWK